MFIKLDKEYEVKCTLGTIKEIEGMFKKPFMTLIGEFSKLTITEQARLLFAGVKKADANITETEFLNNCEDYLGLGDLTEYLEQFIFELQYPGLSRREVEERIEKKLKMTNQLKALTGTK